MSKPTCDACGVSKEDDWFICRPCQKKTARRLTEIPKLHAVLVSDTWLKVPERVESERKPGGKSYGAPANLRVLALVDKRTDVRAVLSPWIVDINALIGSVSVVPTDVRGVCDKLLSLLPWAASNHPAAGELVHEVAAQFVALDRVVSGSRRPPAPVPCPVVLPDSGPCSGFLSLRPDGAVTCRGCGSRWEFEDWRRLGSLLV